jgi:hypothetical protein
MDLQEMGYDVWAVLVWLRIKINCGLMNKIINFWDPQRRGMSWMSDYQLFRMDRLHGVGQEFISSRLFQMMRRFWMVLTMVYHTRQYYFFYFDNLQYSKNICVSETRSVSIQWLRLALSNGPKRVGVYHPLTWGRKQIQFPKRCVL